MIYNVIQINIVVIQINIVITKKHKLKIYIIIKRLFDNNV